MKLKNAINLLKRVRKIWFETDWSYREGGRTGGSGSVATIIE